jgi:hypothetical protein
MTEVAAAPALEISTSRQMLGWMAEQRLSIALTTYQIGKLFLLGLKPGGQQLSVFERSFNRRGPLPGGGRLLHEQPLPGLALRERAGRRAAAGGPRPASRATTRPSAACRWTSGFASAAPRRAAACR